MPAKRTRPAPDPDSMYPPLKVLAIVVLVTVICLLVAFGAALLAGLLFNLLFT